MIKVLTIFSLLFIFGESKAQPPHTAVPLEIRLSPIKYKSKLPFNHIEIIDCRYDSSKVGYSANKKYFNKLVTAKNLSSQLQDSLNSSLNFDTSKKQFLIIVIKRLWLNEGFKKESRTKIEEGNLDFDYSTCSSKLEVYLKTITGFVPLIRIDTSYNFGYSLQVYAGRMLMFPFEKCLSRLEKIDFEAATTKSRKLSWDEIDEFNQTQFKKPILAQVPKQKGLYLTFKDFVENKISAKDFEVDFGKVTDQLYLKENGEKKLFTDFWGFCDGNACYINGGFNFFELHRVGNTFEFWANVSPANSSYPTGDVQPMGGKTNLESWGKGLAYYGIIDGSKKRTVLQPIQIDMDTGNIY